MDVIGVLVLLRGEGCLDAPRRPGPRTEELAAGGPSDFEEVVRLSLGPSRTMVPAPSCNLCNSRLRPLFLEVPCFAFRVCGDTLVSCSKGSRRDSPERTEDPRMHWDSNFLQRLLVSNNCLPRTLPTHQCCPN